MSFASTLAPANGKPPKKSRSFTGWTTSCMQWSCDRTGFPVLELPDLGIAAHLFPVAKVQFERFLAEPVMELAKSPEPARYGDVWYEQLLEVSPRVSIEEQPFCDFEGLFQ